MDMNLILGAAGFILGVGGIILSFYFQHENKKLQKELKRITWSDLVIAAREFRIKINKVFKPDIIFSPCRRGATIANLFIGVNENIFLFVGVREDIRDGDKFKCIPEKLNEHWDTIGTNKYKQYIPKQLLENKQAKLLILDDFAMSGDSLLAITDYLIKNGFDRSNIKTATIVCTDAAFDAKKMPDFFWLKSPHTDFYFPWGKAR